MSLWRERDERYIIAHEFPAAIIELATSRDISIDKLLRGTGIFWEDYLSGELRIKPDQCLQLLLNIRRLLPEKDTAFLLGHRLYPGNFGTALNTVWFSCDLADAIDNFTCHQASLTPLLFARKSVDTEYLYLHWQNNIACGEHFSFLLEMMMTAITSLCSHLTGVGAQWEYLIPGDIDAPEQYQVNFGAKVHAKQHIAAMRIPRQFLSTPCQYANNTSSTIARNQYQKQQQGTATLGFVAYIDECIRNAEAQQLSLETLAEQLSMSPATLKRKLKKHNTSFQHRYDTVRKELVIDWLTRQQLSIDEIAQRLHFHDSRNLRRAFKRWTGALPSAIKTRTSLEPL
ncbi:helix-turn-helix transcriptional regulator [Gilvimarinus sp. SDUM040013]|uniref:Helix-turn-helix transcriptional regulator n=1 Tax=Gilvimarinus gilvus TaxID=3058038 RepID=A0ABU4RVR6_9GAMM|nr:helix-turn-helix transcriptional regulator [Gilvimarinus sp. SDUM040013]MDO3387282.1 helix-turn-helix transcriptional regulator [Gilvimarinus sp. SDUM040013]MDX6848971.1 helix-turn-helix transcriptional regulator [Gilvimarinus sp. SDUM040013]